MKRVLAVSTALVLLLLGGICSAQTLEENSTPRILVAYFSLWGNADYLEDVDATTSASIVLTENGKWGTTQVIAEQILNTLGGDRFLIQTQEAYPTDFQAVIDRNHEEAAQGSLPELTDVVENMAQYDVIFLGYPIWNTTVPQAIQTFLTSYDFSGKTIVPFCTHDGYGSGRSYSAIAEACPGAEVLEGIAIEATEISIAEGPVSDWLNRLSIPAQVSGTETPVLVTVNGVTLSAVLYDTPEAKQFKDMMPLTVSMWNYGGRELYGGLAGDMTAVSPGQLSFADGDITYCEQNHTVAIFYAQTDHPNLTMEVIPMGRVTSDLDALIQLSGDADVTFSLAE